MELSKNFKVSGIRDASYEDAKVGHVEARYLTLYGYASNYDPLCSRLPNIIEHFYVLGVNDIKKLDIGATVKITFTIED